MGLLPYSFFVSFFLPFFLIFENHVNQTILVLIWKKLSSLDSFDSSLIQLSQSEFFSSWTEWLKLHMIFLRMYHHCDMTIFISQIQMSQRMHPAAIISMSNGCFVIVSLLFFTSANSKTEFSIYSSKFWVWMYIMLIPWTDIFCSIYMIPILGSV